MLIYPIGIITNNAQKAFKPAFLGNNLIEIILGKAEFYIIWVVVFLLFRIAFFRRLRLSFRSVLGFVLLLNFVELFFISGNIVFSLNRITENGILGQAVYEALPDLPEVISLVIVSLVFTWMYYENVEQRLLPEKSN